jgi:methyl-accepting chemotaxis protein
MSVDLQEFADVKASLKSISETSQNHTTRLDGIETSMEDDRINLKLLAREVQELASAVRENNKLLKGSNGNSVLVRLALLEASNNDLQDKVDKGNASSDSDNRARLQLIGTSLTAGLALLGTIIIGIFSLLN